MNNMKNTFHIGDILSITSGRLVSNRGMVGIYEILGFLTRDEVYTHEIPRLMGECRPYLAAQFPQLVGREMDDFLSRLVAMLNGVTDRADA